MPTERKPSNLVLWDHPPPHTKPFKVGDGDNWWTIARKFDMDPWDLIQLNFKTRRAAEVNWYLRHYVGCKKATKDRKNWMFSADADPGVIYVPMREINMPPMVIIGETPPSSKLKKVWAGLGKAHSGDLFLFGAHDLTGRIYCLGDDIPDVKNARININGYKMGPGLGASVGAVFIIAHGYEKATEMNGVDGGWDFDIALAAKLGDLLKGVKGLGKAVDTIEKYKKLRYLTENAIKSAGIYKRGVYSIPIPLAGVGLHLWAGYKFGDLTIPGVGVGVP
jgi:hypothetical protein